MANIKQTRMNADYEENPTFMLACQLAGATPTKRQYSKYRNGYGLAYTQKAAAAAQLRA